MRKRMTVAVVLAAPVAGLPSSTEAGVFATEYTQLMNHAQLLMQYLRQAQELAEAVKQTTDMV